MWTSIFCFTLLSTSLLTRTAAAQQCESFPVIDLGYAKHAPTRTNTTASNITYATYANIRFAQPPVGQLRWRKPQTPPPFNATVQDGIVSRNATDCQNAVPPAVAIAPGVAGTTWGSEDCLYLDVKVPEGLQGEKVPVLLWFYGGGYFFGSKEPWAGDPQGLFQQMTMNEKFIAVSSNYRLSGLGWLSPDVEGFDKNVGVYDGLAALEWVHEYISYFGGDPDDITIIGESAGGGVGQMLVTAYAGEKDLPIKKAILTSPGFRPCLNRQMDFNTQYDYFLNASNCTDLACLRSLHSETIALINRDLLFNFNLSTGWIGPGVGYGAIEPDGDLIPDIPWRLLKAGRFQKNIQKILTGGMFNDGLGTTIYPAMTWEENLQFFMATPTQDTIEKVTALYPSNLTDAFSMFAGDVVFKCHSYFLADAFRGDVYRYEMSIPPATHGQDQFYYFYGNATSDLAVEYPEVALAMQAYFRSVILDEYAGGSTCQVNRPHWPTYGDRQRWMNITSEGFELVYGDESRAQRCETILELINDPANGW